MRGGSSRRDHREEQGTTSPNQPLVRTSDKPGFISAQAAVVRLLAVAAALLVIFNASGRKTPTNFPRIDNDVDVTSFKGYYVSRTKSIRDE